MGIKYQLDNVAKIFPSTSNKKNSSVFRLSAVLKDPVDPEKLQKALSKIEDRFPTLKANLRNGFFWNYLETSEKKLKISEEKDCPCLVMDPKKNNGNLIKVLYFKNRISVEVFHVLSNGRGAMEFLKSLLYYYFKLSNKNVTDDGKILLADEPVKKSEVVNSFDTYYKKRLRKKKKELDAYMIKGTEFEYSGNNVTHGAVFVSKLNKVAKKYGVSITVYLTALLIDAIYQTNSRNTNNKKPIMITIPVDLRSRFPSKSLRNFFCIVNIGKVVNEKDNFYELVKGLGNQLKEQLKKENLQEIISNNIAIEKSKFIRLLPLFIKNIIFKIAFIKIGENKKTTGLSNFGKIDIPESFEPFIEQIESTIYPTTKSPINCSIFSFDDKMTITFIQNIRETEIIEDFFSKLSKEGLEVKIYSNNWEHETSHINEEKMDENCSLCRNKDKDKSMDKFAYPDYVEEKIKEHNLHS